MATALDLLTAEEFGSRPDPGYPEELIQGRIVTMPPHTPRHGQICGKADRLLGSFADEHDLGHVLCNDSGVITERDHDTVRGPTSPSTAMRRSRRGRFDEVTSTCLPTWSSRFVRRTIVGATS